MRLNQLRDNPGARQNRTRVGRGIGSGKGKTAGRGVKGQLARSGPGVAGFEGGQMPIYRRLPQRGFVNISAREFSILNLHTLQAAIDSGKLNASQPITESVLKQSGVITHIRDGVRLLGRGALTSKVTIEITGASASARQAVEKAGGTITVLTSAEDKAQSKSEPSDKTSA